jgi:N-acetylmuramoyl-L-alanine amidase
VKTILVSAGHGAADPGAVSPDGQHKEAHLALRLRDLVAAELRAGGAGVVLTDGGGGTNLPLPEAIKSARRAQVAVEIHFNSGPPQATGVECLANPRHRQLAQSLAQAVALSTGLKLRGELGYKPENAGQHRRLAFVQAGGVILEVCFISNAADVAAYLRAEKEVAHGIARALRCAAL